jgi:hypothetical protein
MYNKHIYIYTKTECSQRVAYKYKTKKKTHRDGKKNPKKNTYTRMQTHTDTQYTHTHTHTRIHIHIRELAIYEMRGKAQRGNENKTEKKQNRGKISEKKGSPYCRDAKSVVLRGEEYYIIINVYRCSRPGTRPGSIV